MIFKLTRAVLVVGALSMAGCGKDEAVKEVEALADVACACKDRACMIEQQKRGAELMAKYKDRRVKDSDYRAAQSASKRFEECAQKLAK